jgi:hypothetical protein
LPSLLLLFEPSLNTNLVLVFNVIQYLGVVTYPVIVEAYDEVTGKIRAIRASFDVFFSGGTAQNLTIAAIRTEFAAAETAFTIYFLW